MKLLTGGITLIAVALFMSGCSSQQPEAVSSSIAALPPVQSQAQVAPTPSPTATSTSASSTPVVGKATLKLTRTDGYEANIDVSWHAMSSITFGDALKLCPFLMNSFSARDSAAYKALAVDFSFDYPSVNGFVWPSDAPISVFEVNGGPFCVGSAATYDPRGFDAPSPSSASKDHKTIMIFKGDRSPNHPNGDFGPVNELYMKVSAGGATCRTTGDIGNVAPNICQVGYPGPPS